MIQFLIKLNIFSFIWKMGTIEMGAFYAQIYRKADPRRTMLRTYYVAY